MYSEIIWSSQLNNLNFNSSITLCKKKQWNHHNRFYDIHMVFHSFVFNSTKNNRHEYKRSRPVGNTAEIF